VIWDCEKEYQKIFSIPATGKFPASFSIYKAQRREGAGHKA
jgi:hypothetical protein